MNVRQQMDRIAVIIKNKLHLHAAYKSTFNTPDGQLVIEHLMKECGLLNPKVTTDPNVLQFKAGQQHIVLSILRILEREPKQIVTQIQESMKHEIDE